MRRTHLSSSDSFMSALLRSAICWFSSVNVAMMTLSPTICSRIAVSSSLPDADRLLERLVAESRRAGGEENDEGVSWEVC